MADLKIEFSKEDYRSLENGIADFLNKVLPIHPPDMANPENKLTNLLLSYHSDDGGAITITRIELENVAYDSVQ